MQVFECAPEGEKLKTERDALDLIGEARQQGASLVVIPAERLDDDFFRLKTRLAGEFVQKFVTYQVRLAILGDISGHVSESTSLRDFVREANSGEHLWFVASREELGQRLLRNAG